MVRNPRECQVYWKLGSVSESGAGGRWIVWDTDESGGRVGARQTRRRKKNAQRSLTLHNNNVVNHGCQSGVSIGMLTTWMGRCEGGLGRYGKS